MSENQSIKLHPNDITQKVEVLTNYRISSVGLLSATGLLLLGGAMTNNIGVRTGLIIGSAVTASSAKVISKKEEELEQLLMEAKVIDRTNWLDRYRLATSPTITSSIEIGYTSNWQPEYLFKWSEFNTNPDENPHIALLGNSGGGKSVTAEWMSTWLDGTTIVIAPHRKPNDFPGMRTFCGGRNYGSYDDEAPDFQQLLEDKYKNISVAALCKSLYREMDRRYQLMDNGIEDYAMTNIIWDEYNASISAVKELASDVIQLIREARKVRLRLIILVQGSEVKSLGFEGSGSVRNSIRCIRIGKDADKYAKSLDSEYLVNWFRDKRKQGLYPCMVDDEPAIIPRYQRADIAILPTRLPREEVEFTAIPTLDDPQLNRIIQVWTEKQDWVSARDCQNTTSPLFKGMKPDDIRLLFVKLEAVGHGETTRMDDRDDRLCWRLQPPNE